jgi:hypothetical protein
MSMLDLEIANQWEPPSRHGRRLFHTLIWQLTSQKLHVDLSYRGPRGSLGLELCLGPAGCITDDTLPTHHPSWFEPSTTQQSTCFFQATSCLTRGRLVSTVVMDCFPTSSGVGVSGQQHDLVDPSHSLFHGPFKSGPVHCPRLTMASFTPPSPT